MPLYGFQEREVKRIAAAVRYIEGIVKGMADQRPQKPPAFSLQDGIEFVINGGGAAIAAGFAGFLYVPFGCVIVEARLVADTSTTCQVDIWADTTFAPTNADTITGGAELAITAGTSDIITDPSGDGWTCPIAATSWLGFNVDSNDNALKLTIALTVNR